MIDWLFGHLSWQAIILFSGLMTGFSHFVRKSQLHKFGVFQINFWKDVSSFALGFALLFSGKVTIEPIGWLIVLAGFLSGIGNGAYTSAIRGDLSGSSTFGTAAGQLFILLGSFLFFGEWKYFEPSTLTGLINLICVIVFLVGMLLYSEAKIGRWWKMMFVSIITNVIVNLASKWLLGYGVLAAENTALLYFGNVIADVVFLWRKRQLVWIGKRDIGLGLIQGLMGGMAVFLYMKALEIAPLSLVSVTRRATILAFTVFAGMVWFGERKALTWKKIVGLGLALGVFGMVAGVNG